MKINVLENGEVITRNMTPAEEAEYKAQTKQFNIKPASEKPAKKPRALFSIPSLDKITDTFIPLPP